MYPCLHCAADVFAVCCFKCVSVIFGGSSVEWGSDEARAANDVCPQLK